MSTSDRLADWPLPGRLALTVAVHEHALSRDELARLLGMVYGSDRFNRALWQAYRRGLVDMCGEYVVTPPPREPSRP